MRKNLKLSLLGLFLTGSLVITTNASAIVPPRHKVLDIKYINAMPDTFVNPIGHPFVYDGLANETFWSTLEWNNIDTKYNTASNAPTSADDASARFKICHNGSNICIYIEGKDEILINPIDNMLKDQIELYFGIKNNSEYNINTSKAGSENNMGAMQFAFVIREDSSYGGWYDGSSYPKREIGGLAEYGDNFIWGATNGTTYGFNIASDGKSYSGEIVINQKALGYTDEYWEEQFTNFCTDGIDFDIVVQDIDKENASWATDKTWLTWNVTGTYGQLWESYEEIGFTQLEQPVNCVCYNVEIKPIKPASPTITTSEGNYDGAQYVYINNNAPKTELYYTINESEPTMQSIKYTGPIFIKTSTLIKVKAFLNADTASDVVTAKYYIYNPIFKNDTTYVPVYINDTTFIQITDIKAQTNSVVLNGTIVGLKTYPNPAKNKVVIEATETITKLEIYNLLGEMVNFTLPNAMQTQVDVSQLATATYTLKITTSKGVINSKLVVSK